MQMLIQDQMALLVMLTLVQIHRIVASQQDRMIHILMLQLDQIQVIVTLHRR